MKGTKSRFGRYLAGGGPRYITTNASGQQARAPAPVSLWSKGAGAISKRFDGKEEPKMTAVSNQSRVLFILNIIFFHIDDLIRRNYKIHCIETP